MKGIYHMELKLATRLNAYLPHYNNDLEKVFEQLEKVGINYVDINFPQQTLGITPEHMKEMLDKHNLQPNGMEMRFETHYLTGDLGNPDEKLYQDAIKMCKEAADYCHAIGGSMINIWSAHDGFDYSFQIDYVEYWNRIVKACQEVADYAPDIRWSIEYKPYEPRGYAFVDSMGIVEMMLHDINRKNFGVLLDYCHMLMKHENPAMGTALFCSRKQLFGVHLNDGYGVHDDGLMVGTVTPFKTLEFLYYMKKYNFDGMIYFDTEPVREDPSDETKSNIEMLKYLLDLLDQIGMDKIQQVIDSNDGVKARNLMLEFLQK
ncbi:MULTISPECIES: sugar phosphate isomerase/epimerase [unclassified Lactobacillus]|uniref:sugar phosphate isomerase/epimerase family protein n=1 Tax=unclassified Lactobacillus TaxID=2620435 RepID=UPI001F1A3C7B|nr:MULTISPECIES: sugar phosphate isomerase/epimerase family protein [unclassified Lactobacillus]